MLSVYAHLAHAHHNENPIDTLLTPSWLSGLLAILAGLVIVGGSLALFYYHGSSLNYLVAAQQAKQASAQAAIPDYQDINGNIGNNSWVSDVPLLVFWAGIGVIAYTFTAAIINGLRSAAELHEELGYVHAGRQELLKWSLERSGLRLAMLILWLVYVSFTVHTILPYAAAVSYAGTATGSWLKGVVFILFGVAIVIVCVHIHTIFLRLIALRPRLFG